jgi:hypothetical protein
MIRRDSPASPFAFDTAITFVALDDAGTRGLDTHARSRRTH